MRGTGTNIILVTQDAPVSFLMDEFALSHVTSQFISLFDTHQVEVYRGPQGTLFGKNTTGGVISITSKKPLLGEYGAEAQVSYGQYEGSASARSVSAAVNVPIGRHARDAHRSDLRPGRRLLHRRQEDGDVPDERAALGPFRPPGRCAAAT